MLDYIKSVSSQLTRRVVFAYAFRWGAYGAVLAVLFALASKLIIPSFHLSSPVSYFCIIAGLLIGLAIGIINRPTLIQTAIYLDQKLNTRDHLSTLMECLNKTLPNPVEAQFINKSAISNPQFAISYKYSYLILFLIAVIVLVIVQQTPLPTLGSRDISNRTSHISNQQVQIANLKSQIQQAQAVSNESVKQLIKQIEQLVREIEQGSTAPSMILARLTEFSRTAQGLPQDDKDTAKVQALLDKLQEYYKISDKGQPGFTRATESAQKGTGGTGGGETESLIPYPQPLTPVAITPVYLKKLGEEAMSKPYWPSEYNEVIKKYFSNQ